MPTGLLEFSLLSVLIFSAALVYSTGGHAGASAYLAAMALFGMAPAVMKPTALMMNILVALVGSFRFTRARAVPWRLVWPLCLGSIPAAFLGGHLQLPSSQYLTLLGASLLLAATGLWLPRTGPADATPPHASALVAIGGVFGLLAGLTGIGGGVFLSPVVILSGWADPRRAGGAAAVFILANSTFGFLGHISAASLVPPQAAVLAIFALAGGFAGSWLGVHRVPPNALRRVHAVILVLSGMKLLYEGGIARA